MGEALEFLEGVARNELPDYAQIDWKGESREYQKAGSAVLLTFTLALLVVYLVLAAQFESFIHPFVIMLTVPLGVLGALIGLAVTGGTLNLFSQIGIVMLRSEEHTSELQSLMRTSYAVFCLKKQTT